MSAKPSEARVVRWNWIHDRRVDRTWYIGSALAGWAYVALILGVGRGLRDPIRDTFVEIELGGLTLGLSLGLVVVGSWALLIDAPHVWATLARTFLDPDEWRGRRRVLLTSLALFALGPIAVFGPYALGMVVSLTPAAMAAGSSVFFVFFRLWAYYHVVRQHWGFLVLYKRRNDDWSDPVENRADFWFFNVALYLPLLMFIASPWYASTGMPELGFRVPVFGAYSIGSLVYPVAVVAYPVALACYGWFQLTRYRRGRARNGPKLLLLAAIVPLHVVVFVDPLLALFVVPVVTVGHNLQYHRVVWSFGRNKYLHRRDPTFRFARAAFRSVPVYLVLGLGFTFLLYQGPWVRFVKGMLARVIDGWILPGIGMVAGVPLDETPGLGAQVAATLFLGWAMQHYYLDAHIWRVRSDPAVEANIYSEPTRRPPGR